MKMVQYFFKIIQKPEEQIAVQLKSTSTYNTVRKRVPFRPKVIWMLKELLYGPPVV